MNSRELALTSLFASTWMAAQITLGPVLGRFSFGPVSMHGVVNRVIGWLLMLVLAEITGRFGNVSVMAGISAFGTRIIRISALSGLATGLGYAIGGFCFDVLYFKTNSFSENNLSREHYILGVTTISGLVASLPYLIYKYLFFSPDAFWVYVPLHIVSSVKGVLFSIVGILLGFRMLDRLAIIGLKTQPFLIGVGNEND